MYDLSSINYYYVPHGLHAIASLSFFSLLNLFVFVI